ncbi:AAA family ATPase [candidate division WOR-1 bacterium RIFCSPLOWO2_12_FULL_45_9]|uniref:AAA family ATPase n=1 Tax=candidate division WOR-1 bacterium RIFCSPLOWO2_12_FULL_45_9 TaxID=1802568 RepID=A0A1F4RK79_UNCSA|nr:MAG: AAA family ATPase [candidate division WOR-1 bacterium RIFCSPLOWO2_12_FULL_45_9]
MIKRHLSRKIKEAAKKYPVISLVGPRQSGKTTLAKMTFPRQPYVSLEKPSELAFALEDPEGFLARYPRGAVIDEAQKAPELFSYIQAIVDEKQTAGRYVLTGSQNFNFLQRVTESLAGRTSIQKLLPFSLGELLSSPWNPTSLAATMFTGGYPRIYDKGIRPTDWLGNYVLTYLERDVRSIIKVGDLSVFQRFLKMCAFRSGKLLNLSALANDCGITHNTARAWLSVLEASFIVFTLTPHFKNFNKRLVKTPKLFFYDTGLLCYLLGIEDEKGLMMRPEAGAIFGTFIISELLKNRANRGEQANLYFWQDKLGREVDCLIDKGKELVPVEIKTGRTISQEYFKNLNYWCDLAKCERKKSFVVYAGEQSQKRSQGTVLGWRDIVSL